MKRLLYALALLLPFLAACGSGGSTFATQPQVANVPSTSLYEDEVTRSAQTQAMRQPQYVSSSSDLLYVGNITNNSITVYRHDVSGNATPLRVIAGSNTGIDTPGQLSEDAQGNLYVANGDYALPRSAHPAILVFAHGASGNVAPIRKLSGAATGLHNIGAMTVDKTTGKIFVFDYSVPGTSGRLIDVSLLRFAPNAAGNVAPFARSAPTLFPAYQIDSDSTGIDLIEAHNTNEPDTIGDGINVLVKQFPNAATPGSPYQVYYLFAGGVADDPTTKTYLAATANGIYRLAERTSGAAGGPNGVDLTPPPVSVITSATCGGQLSLGYLRNIYTTCGNAVDVYSHDASGHVSPLRVISGSATGLDAPFGIYEGQ